MGECLTVSVVWSSLQLGLRVGSYLVLMNFHLEDLRELLHVFAIDNSTTNSILLLLLLLLYWWPVVKSIMLGLCVQPGSISGYFNCNSVCMCFCHIISVSLG